MNLACLREIKKVLHPRNTLSLSNLTLDDFFNKRYFTLYIHYSAFSVKSQHFTALSLSLLLQHYKCQ